MIKEILFSCLCFGAESESLRDAVHLSNPLRLLCSVHHGCWTAGLPLRPQLLAGAILLRGLGHLLRRRVPDRMGLHAGYRWSDAHRLLALFCQICAEGAAVPHPSAHAVIVHWYNNILPTPPHPSDQPRLDVTERPPASRVQKVMLFGTLSSCICYVAIPDSLHWDEMFCVTILLPGYNFDFRSVMETMHTEDFFFLDLRKWLQINVFFWYFLLSFLSFVGNKVHMCNIPKLTRGAAV